MRVAYFPGCKINFGLASYGRAVEKVMAGLGVTLVKLPFNCCGNPSRGKNLTASVLAAVKNLALAQEQGLDILTPCKCCFGQLKHGLHWYTTQEGLKEKIDLTLAEERLVFKSTGLVQEPITGRLRERPVRIRHLLDFLYHDLGKERLASQIKNPFDGTEIVLQQGCHAIRPYSVTQFDNPFVPIIFKEMTRIIGLTPLSWSKETECCGDPAAQTHRAMAMKMASEKLKSAASSGARHICTACTHCQIQYTRVLDDTGLITAQPFVLFLGKAMGLKGKIFNIKNDANK